MKYKAVIFDLFGTLVDNFSQEEYKKTLAEMASILSAPPDEFARLWGETFDKRATGVFKTPAACARHICDKLRIKDNRNNLLRAGQVKTDYTARSLKPRAEALPVLTAIKASGRKLGLLSDCTSETPPIWQTTTLAPLFDAAIFSCVVGIKKPNPRIYLMIADKLGVRLTDCLYIGDGSSQELSGALGMGMRTVLIRDPNDPADASYIDREDDWRGPVITSLKEVLNLLGE